MRTIDRCAPQYSCLTTGEEQAITRAIISIYCFIYIYIYISFTRGLLFALMFLSKVCHNAGHRPSVAPCR